MLRFGLTGGIGSGKTTVAKLFEMLGVPVFYADTKAHRLRSRPEVSEQIIQQFGSKILTENEIDKQKLAEIVFNDDDALQWINSLLHPLVIAEFERWCEHVRARHASPVPKFIIMESALLFEANLEHLFDKIIVVDAPEDLRISRIMNRENISKDAVLQRMSKQISADEKRQKADIIIHNDEQHSLIKQVASVASNISEMVKGKG